MLHGYTVANAQTSVLKMCLQTQMQTYCENQYINKYMAGIIGSAICLIRAHRGFNAR